MIMLMDFHYENCFILYISREALVIISTFLLKNFILISGLGYIPDWQTWGERWETYWPCQFNVSVCRELSRGLCYAFSPIDLLPVSLGSQKVAVLEKKVLPSD